MEKWFDGKVSLVTGAGDGIGRASAILFAARGAKVMVSDVNANGAAETAEIIRNRGGEAIAVKCDVTDKADVAMMMSELLSQFGRIDCAMNNAGVTLAADGAWDDDAFRKTIEINLVGMMNCLKVELPEMLRTGGGTVVNTASTSGFTASSEVPLPGYTASKHGVIGLTKAAALQYARQNIRVNALCPGVTMTAIVRSVMDYSPEAKQKLENFSPMGRMGTAEEMAEAAVWLCSDKSSFVNGHSLVVDGGYLAT